MTAGVRRLADKLSPKQPELLAAIGRGEVAHRYHYACGWAARWHTLNGRPLRSSGRGGAVSTPARST